MANEHSLKERAEFRVVDASEKLPFADASFDAVICIDSINHFLNRRLVISEWARILKPKGRLLFTDPIIVTGALSATEIAIRSSIGVFLFVPMGFDESVIGECGLRLIWSDDVTEIWRVSPRVVARPGRQEQPLFAK